MKKTLNISPTASKPKPSASPSGASRATPVVKAGAVAGMVKLQHGHQGLLKKQEPQAQQTKPPAVKPAAKPPPKPAVKPPPKPPSKPPAKPPSKPPSKPSSDKEIVCIDID